jgi:phosphohistidine phosphatase SixA
MNKAVLKIIIATGVLAIVRLADAQQAIFLVRHAEDVRSKDVVDRPLTESGQRRATLLASVLRDAGIDAIFTSSLQRAVKTAEPLATALRNRAEAPSATHHEIRTKEYGGFC